MYALYRSRWPEIAAKLLRRHRARFAEACVPTRSLLGEVLGDTLGDPELDRAELSGALAAAGQTRDDLAWTLFNRFGLRVGGRDLATCETVDDLYDVLIASQVGRSAD